MNRQEHLLVILAEECAEVAQRASKALRFGLEEIQPGQKLTNVERLKQELNDLISVASMLESEGVSLDIDVWTIEAKKDKIEKFLKYSEKCGTLNQQ